MTIKEMADRLVSMFGTLEKAREYVVIWQDEYTTEQERIFRQNVKKELDSRL